MDSTEKKVLKQRSERDYRSSNTHCCSFPEKGPVKLANQAGENNSFIFTVCVKSVPLYHFKLAYVTLQMVVKEVFKTPLPKMEI